MKKIYKGLKRRLKLLMMSPPVGLVRFGSLRRLNPISRNFGFDRGISIARYYIYDFLSRHSADIKRHVLEIGDNICTRKFGESRVTKSDVLHVEQGNPLATIVADLTRADHIASNTFDCIIFIQTLQCIYDTKAAIKTLYRLLKPGGILLATTKSLQLLFQEEFKPQDMEIKVYGNVLSTISYLHGISATELKLRELHFHDPDYELVLALRAKKTE